MSGIRKLRAALMIALTWGLFWGVAGTVIAFAVVLVFQSANPFSEGWGQIADMFLLFVGVGGAMGLTFSGIMAVAGRRGGWSLTRGRALLLGAMGGALGYLLFAVGTRLFPGGVANVTPLIIAVFTGIGAITGMLTFGTVARGKLPASSDESKRIEE